MSFLDALVGDVVVVKEQVTELLGDMVIVKEQVDTIDVSTYLADGESLATPTVFSRCLRSALADAHNVANPPTVFVPRGQYTLDLDDLNTNGPFAFGARGASVDDGTAGFLGADDLLTVINVPSAYSGIVFFLDRLGATSPVAASLSAAGAFARMRGFTLATVGSACTLIGVRGGLYHDFENVSAYGATEVDLTGKVQDWAIGCALRIFDAPVTQNNIGLHMRRCRFFSCFINVWESNSSLIQYDNCALGQSTAFNIVVNRAAQLWLGGEWQTGAPPSGLYSSAWSFREGCRSSLCNSGWRFMEFPRSTATVSAPDGSGDVTVTGLTQVMRAEDVGSLARIGTYGAEEFEITEFISASSVKIRAGSWAGTGAQVVACGRIAVDLTAPSAGEVTIDTDISAVGVFSGDTGVGLWCIIDEASDSANKGIFRVLRVENLGGALSTWRMVLEKSVGSLESGVQCYFASTLAGTHVTTKGDVYSESTNHTVFWIEPAYNGSQYICAEMAQFNNIERAAKSLRMNTVGVEYILTDVNTGTLVDIAELRTASALQLNGFNASAPGCDLSVLSPYVRNVLSTRGAKPYNPQQPQSLSLDRFLLRELGAAEIWRAEDATLSGSDVTAWNGWLHASAWAPGNAAIYPQYTASHAKLNGKPAVEFDTAASAAKAFLVGTLTGSLIPLGAYWGMIAVFALPDAVVGVKRRIYINGGGDGFDFRPNSSNASGLIYYNPSVGNPTSDYGQSGQSTCSHAFADASPGLWAYGGPDYSSPGAYTILVTGQGHKGETAAFGARRSVTTDIAMYVGSYLSEDQQAWSLARLALITVAPTEAELRRLAELIEAHYGIVTNNGLI